jgi:hypothetical protein
MKKITSILTTLFLLFSLNVIAQIDTFQSDTLVPVSFGTNLLNLQQETVVEYVYLYEAGFSHKNVHNVEFTYTTRKGKVRHSYGTLRHVELMWSPEYGGKEIINTHYEYYILGSDGMRYELKDVNIDGTTYNSVTKKHKFCLFKRKPEYVWNAKFI